MESMKAVLLAKVTEAKDIVLSEVPIPKAESGWVLVKVRAFGMNHSEQILRSFEIENDYIQKPVVPGIECAGEIVAITNADEAQNPRLKAGQKIVALMGGMGRSFNGSYAEYALIPVSHVFAVESSLSWSEIAAVPETYFTAWGSLFKCLRLKPEDTLLIRGATCALGYASIQIARSLGCHVTATTHRENKLALLDVADEALLDDGNLAPKYAGKFTKILELVGCKTIRDSLLCAKYGGIVCGTGVLGGVFALDDFDPIKEIPNGVYLTGFFSNYPTQGTIDDIFSFLEAYRLKPLIGKKFRFAEIAKACEEYDGGKINGKVVVEL